MRQALIGFSFDDGRMDSFRNGYAILKRFDFPATFNITTGYVLDRQKSIIGTEEEPMTLEMLEELYRDSRIEIASHGNRHQNTKEDIADGVQSLCRLLRTNSLYHGMNGFASPHSQMEGITPLKEKLQEHHIQYVRLSLRNLSFPVVKTFVRKISRIIKWPVLYRIAYSDTLMDHVEDNIVYSIPVLSSVTVNQLHAVIKQAIKKRKACILMFHSIVEKSGLRDNWDFEVDKFERICQVVAEYQQRNLLKVATTMDIFRQLKP